MSTVKSVEHALKTPASDPMSADSSPATTMPRRPERQQMLHHQREGALRRVRIGMRTEQRVGQPRIPAALRERVANQARDDEQVRRKQLQEGGEDAAAPSLGLSLGAAERALHDVLIRAPVPEADDRRADQPCRATGSGR